MTVERRRAVVEGVVVEQLIPSETWDAAVTWCFCGARSCAHFDTGYPWCVRCQDHHRHPETCPGITEAGTDA